MNPLSKLQNALFLVSGILLAAGAGCYAFLLVRPVAAVAFLAGAVGFCAMQQVQVAPLRHHPVLTLRRLHRIMTFAHLLFIVAGLLMVEEQFQPIGQWLAQRDQDGGARYISFVMYTHGKWVIMLLIAAIVELYTTHRISSELEKEE